MRRQLSILAIVTVLCVFGLAYAAEPAADIAPAVVAGSDAVTTPEADRLLIWWGLIGSTLTAIGVILGGVGRLLAIWFPTWGPLVWINKVAGWASDLGTKTPLSPRAKG